MCMRVCAHEYMHACVCVSTCVCMNNCVCVCICDLLSMCVFTRAWKYVGSCVNIYACIQVYAWTWELCTGVHMACMCVCERERERETGVCVYACTEGRKCPFCSPVSTPELESQHAPGVTHFSKCTSFLPSQKHGAFETFLLPHLVQPLLPGFLEASVSPLTPLLSQTQVIDAEQRGPAFKVILLSFTVLLLLA